MSDIAFDLKTSSKNGKYTGRFVPRMQALAKLMEKNPELGELSITPDGKGDFDLQFVLKAKGLNLLVEFLETNGEEESECDACHI